MFAKIVGRRATALFTTLAVVLGLAITPAFTATAAEGDEPIVAEQVAAEPIAAEPIAIVEVPAPEAPPAPETPVAPEAPAPAVEEPVVEPAPVADSAPAVKEQDDPEVQSPIAPLNARMAAPVIEEGSGGFAPMAMVAASGITPATIGPFVVNQNISPLSIQFQYSGTDRWVSSGLPSGLSLNPSNGKLTGKASVAGIFTVTVTAQELQGYWDWDWHRGWYYTYQYVDIASATYTVIVGNPAPVVSTSSLSGATVGSAYSQQLAATGVGTMTYRVSAGNLPAGLTLSSTGLISGTPNYVPGYDGSDTITFSVIANNGTDSAPKQLSITVTTPAPALGTTPLPAATVGTSYSQALPLATGYGTLTYTINSGSLPQGLALGSNGVISGTPTYAETYSATQVFTFTATVTGPTGSSSRLFTLTLNVTGPTITTTALPEAWLTESYPGPIAITGAGATLSATGLPTGLSLTGNSVTGYSITGTPTAHGDFSVTLTATNAGGTASATLNLTVNPAPVITTIALPVATVGSAYSAPIAASGKDVTFTATGVAGVSISAAGELTWTPSTELVASVQITATNRSGSHSRLLQLASYAVPTISDAAFSYGVVGRAFSQTVSFTGMTATTAVTDGTLPTGLTLLDDGSFDGTPTASGTFSFEVTATNPVGSDSQRFDITIYDRPTIQTNRLDRATVGEPYSDAISFTGLGAEVELVRGALPTGLTLNADGTITGTPTEEGAFEFRVKVSNEAGAERRSYTIRSFQVPEITSTDVDPAVTGVSYRDRILATGDGAVFSIIKGSLPDGLTLTRKGVLKGTAVEAGTFTFTVRAKNPVGADRQQFTITVTVPAVQLSASTIIRGNTLTVSGTGFIPGDDLELWLHSTPVLLGTATAAGGAFTSSIVIPASTEAGAHELVVVSSQSGTHSVPLTIALPAVAPAAPQPPRAATPSQSPSLTVTPSDQSTTVDDTEVVDDSEVEENEADEELPTLNKPEAAEETPAATPVNWTGYVIAAFALLLAALALWFILWRRRRAEES